VRRNVGLTTGVQFENWNFPVLAPTTRKNTTASFEVIFHPKWTLH
jgi:hypothetical protein